MKLISKPILIGRNENKIINIQMNSLLKREKILNTDLLGKIIKIYIKDKEIKNKSLKSEIKKLFTITNTRLTSVSFVKKKTSKLINELQNNYEGIVKNWYDIINIKEVKSEISCIIIKIKGRINTRIEASRTKTYIYKSNTKQNKDIGEVSVLKLILKNGSIGIKIYIDSINKIKV
jgi:hypothetical protein